jgi:hypothetical protein
MTAVAPEPRLSDFYLRLADDPSLLEQYERDPEAALAAAGMTDPQINAVHDGSDAVRSVLESELASEPGLRRLVTEPRMMTQGDGGPEDEDGDDDDDGDEPGDG